MATESVLTGLEPRAFWAHFEALTRLARPSHHEEPAIEHVRAWAAEHGFEVRQDAARNVVIDVPATPGLESAPVVVLQGHLDMVCERSPDSPNDPAEGRIALVVDGDWVRADGTTLGADDGVAIAAMMALAEDPSLRHGPLQLLMTVAEEVGLGGANDLDGALIRGSVLLNLDSEDDSRLTVGCAGSTDAWLRLPQPRAPVDAGERSLAVTVAGGLGGHSGADIHLGRANAIKVLGLVLREARREVPFRLVSLNGGRSRNAIPRDAVAVCAVPEDCESDLSAAVESAAATVRAAFAKTDAGLTIRVAGAEPATDAWTAAGTATLLDALVLVPAGPLALSPDFEGLVETSTSLGQAVTEGEVLTLRSLSRSSNDAALPDVIASLDAIASLAGGRLETKHNHRGWQPDLDSKALATVRDVFERLFGEQPRIGAVHGGLEPAAIGARVPGLEMVSFGPTIEGPHSPDERLSIASVERFWRLTVGVVQELARTQP